MPRQKGTTKIIGTIGELTYYESVHGFLIRRTAKNRSERIKKDPEFLHTRNNAQEFGQVAKTAGQFRKLMGATFQDCGDMNMTSRLMSVLHKVMKQDTLSKDGERLVIKSLEHSGGQALLKGFEVNAQKPLTSVYKGILEVDTQKGIIRLPFYEPYLKSPASATHVQFTSAWMRLAPEKENGRVIHTKSDHLLIADLRDTLEMIPDQSLPGEGPLILMLHIQFFRQQGDVLETLQENRCGQVVEVW